MSLHINDFFSKETFSEFQEYDAKNYWFGATSSFAGIYSRILDASEELIRVDDDHSLFSILSKEVGLENDLVANIKCEFPCYVNVNGKIIIQPFRVKKVGNEEILSNPVFWRFETEDFIEKSFFKSLTKTKLILSDAGFEKGAKFTPLYYIKIFRSQVAEFNPTPSRIQVEPSFSSSKEVFLEYSLDSLSKIVQLFSDSNSWNYSGQYGGIRENENDNWIDFTSEEGEVFQFQYLGEETDCNLWFSDQDGTERELPDDLIKLVARFFKSGDFSEIEDEIERRNQSMKSTQKSWVEEFDTDGNGEVDVIEGNDFSILLQKHQSEIVAVDKQYVQDFVRISNYLKTKRQNIKKVFMSIQTANNPSELQNYIGILKNQIHTYETLLLHSLAMITSLVNSDLITFYEIYEAFDKLKVFNSDWENEVSQKLSNIDEGLSGLMHSIDSMERNIVKGLNELNYTTQEGFASLSQSVTRELQSIDSSEKFNTLLTGISTYQLYNINKQTKGLTD